ncbi:MAG: hypothetical protein IJQ15_05130 [Synergistaceae bacterium]|nr:hypothetical protein [Synergistaceae bacterium]MBQ4401365.1 hypothetical protein [Synergistaceae bacterium]MBQ6419012.1 hypothetical protein [Synergistaceae bacterium]MBQ6665002.1 hypothetical protein [Synergistaceae bacterium]MBQ6981795.1 hypothetical protein [Synergistaceae bacterium]
MKKALTAGLVLAGVLAVSGSAFAAPKKPVLPKGTQLPQEMRKIAKVQQNDQKPPMPPEGFDGKRPPLMSRDKRPPMPPDGRQMSRDKRPPMPPRSGDRRPPEFDNRPPQQGVQPKR